MKHVGYVFLGAVLFYVLSDQGKEDLLLSGGLVIGALGVRLGDFLERILP